MVEKISLMTPAKANPGTMSWAPVIMNIDRESGTLKLGFRGDNGEYHSVIMSSDVIPHGIWRAVMQRALNDGTINGSITGTPV